jgi:hypothetical protein
MLLVAALAVLAFIVLALLILGPPTQFGPVGLILSGAWQ